MQRSSTFRISDLISEDQATSFFTQNRQELNHTASHNIQLCNCISCQTLRFINFLNPIYMNCRTTTLAPACSPTLISPKRYHDQVPEHAIISNGLFN